MNDAKAADKTSDRRCQRQDVTAS